MSDQKVTVETLRQSLTSCWMNQHEKLPFITELVQIAHQTAIVKGFWDEGGKVGAGVMTKPWNFGEKVALMHSELSELLEKYRKNPTESDEHCSRFTNLEIEAADIFIRLADLSGKMKWRLQEAIIAKMEFNLSRPYKHGKAF